MSEFDDLVLDDYELDGELTKQLDGLLNNTAAPSSETQDPEEATKKPVKRPKLDDERLLGEKGISALKNRSQYLSFKGKGHEEQDLKDLMQFYMFWANNLFPKLKFQDFAKRVTKPASTAAVKSQIKTWQEEFKERRQVRLEVENELNRQNESEDEQSRSQEEEEEEASSEDDNRPLFFPITKPLPTNKPKPKKAVHRPHQASTHESNKSGEDETESSSSHRKRRMVSLDDSSDEEQEPSSSGTKNRQDVLALLQERRRQKEDAKKKEQEKAEQEELMKKKAELERSAEELTQEYLGEDVELALSDSELLLLNKDDTSFSDNELIQDLDTHQEEDESMTDV